MDALIEHMFVDGAIKEGESQYGGRLPLDDEVLRKAFQLGYSVGSQSGYPYRNLNDLDGEIRLLVLQPNADPSTKIQCKLSHCSRRNRRAYAALSYCWENAMLRIPERSILTAIRLKLRQTSTLHLNGSVTKIRT